MNELNIQNRNLEKESKLSEKIGLKTPICSHYNIFAKTQEKQQKNEIIDEKLRDSFSVSELIDFGRKVLKNDGSKTKEKISSEKQFEIFASFFGEEPFADVMFKQFSKFSQELHESSVEDVAKKYEESIKKLEKGSSQFLYTDFEGISQICRIMKKEDGLFYIDLYSPGQSTIASEIISGDKIKRQYRYTYDDVPEKLIHEQFLKALIQRNNANKNSSPGSVKKSPSDQALIPFFHLEPYRKSTSPIEGEFHTGSKASLINPLKAFFRSRYLDEGKGSDYKQNIFRNKLRFLEVLYKNCQEAIKQDTPEGEELRNVLDKAVANIGRAARKKGASSWLTPVDKYKISQLSKSIVQAIDLARREIHEKRSIESTPTKNEPLLEEQQNERSKVFGNKKISPLPKKSAVSKCSSLPMLSSVTDGKSFLDVSDEILKKYENAEMKNPLEILSFNVSLASIVDQLPIPELKEKCSINRTFSSRLRKVPFWEDLNLENKRKCLSNFEKLIELYTLKKSTFQKDELIRFHRTGLSLLVQIHYLAGDIDRNTSKNDKSSLFSYSIFSLNECFSKHIGMINFNPKDSEKISQLRKYLDEASSNEQKDLFIDEYSIDMSLDGEKLSSSYCRGYKVDKYGKVGPNGPYWQALLENNPELDKEFTSEVKHVIFTKFYQYGLDRFEPPRWFKPNKDDLLIIQNMKKIACLEMDGLNAKAPHLLEKHGLGHVIDYRKGLYYLGQALRYHKTPKPLVATFSVSEYGKHWGKIKKEQFTYPDKEEKEKLEITPQHIDFILLLGKSTCDNLKLLGKKDHSTFESLVLKDEFAEIEDVKTLRSLRHFIDYRSSNLSEEEKKKNLEKFEKLERTWQGKKKILQRLLRLLISPDTAPLQLVEEFMNQTHHLDDRLVQGLFTHIFFALNSRLENNILLQKAAWELIHRGLRDCSVLIDERTQGVQEEREKALARFRFFSELSFHLCKYFEKHGLRRLSKEFELTQEIKIWLQESKPSPSEAAVFHHGLLLFYSLKPLQELSDEEIIDVYSSLSQYRLSPQNGETTSQTITYARDAFIIKLGAQIDEKLKKEPKFREKLALAITQDLKSEKWEYQFGILSNDVWEINLLSGAIIRDKNLISNHDIEPTWEKEPFFKKLFGDQKFNYYKLEEGAYEFKLPSGPTFQIYIKKLEQKKEIQLDKEHQKEKETQFILRARFDDEQWFRYQEIEEKKQQHCCPFLLLDNYAYWIPEKSDEKVAGYFTRLGQWQRNFSLNGDGTLSILENVEGKIVDNGSKLSYYSSDTQDALIAFEERNYIHLIHQGEEITQWQFPRIVSAEGNPLIFKVSGNNLIWSSNVNYQLSENKYGGYFGKNEKYLELEPKDKEASKKLLVPLKRLKKNKSNSSSETTPYFVFDIDKKSGQPSAVTLEGKLYHAYLMAMEGDFQSQLKALELIKSIPAVENLSPTVLKILQMITEDIYCGDLHGIMIVFHALVAIFRQDEKSFKKTCDVKCERLPNLIERYLQLINNIPESMRLHADDEIFFIEKVSENKLLKNEFCDTDFTSRLSDRKDFLNNLNKEKEKLIKLKVSHNVFEIEENLFTESVSFVPPQWVSANKDSLPNGIYNTSSISVTHQDVAGNWTQICEVLTMIKNGEQEKIRAEIYKLTCWYFLIGCRDDKGNTNDIIFLLYLLKSNTTINIPEKRGWNDFLKSVRNICELQEKQKMTIQLISKCHQKDRKDKEVQQLRIDNHYDTRRKQIADFGKKSSLTSNEENSIQEQKVESSLNIQFPDTSKRFSKLKNWEKEFLDVPEIEKEKLEKIEDGCEKVVDDNDLELLREREKERQEAFNSDLDEWEQDYKEGRLQNLGKAKATWKTENEIDTFLNEVNEEMNDVIKEIKKQRRLALFLANKGSKEDEKFLDEELLLIARQRSLVTFSDCVKALQEMDFRAYQQMNPHLSLEEAESLLKMTLEVEHLKSYKEQLERLARIGGNIKKNRLNDKDPIREKSLCNLLLNELRAKYHFDEIKNLDLEKRTLFHIFCGESDMILRDKQVDVLTKMDDEDKMIELLMGEGKTSVIAAYATYLMAQREDALSIFLVPSSLFDSIKINLSRSIQKTFKKELIPLDFEMEDLQSVENLLKIEELILRTIKNKEPMIAKSKAWQYLQLEFGRLMEYTYGPKPVDLPDAERKIEILARILSLLEEKKSWSLTDEIHTILDALQEINIPMGEQVPIRDELNDLIHLIFSILASDEVKVSGLGSMNDVVKLDVNRQELLKDNYQSKVLPGLFEQLKIKFTPIARFIQGKEKSFERFVMNKIPYAVQALSKSKETSISYDFMGWQDFYSDLKEVEEDVEFLKELAVWANGSEEKSHDDELSNKKVADIICWMQHILNVVLPITLSKSGNKYYGNDPKPGSDKVIKYLDVGVPGTTEIADCIEKACYNYQHVLAFGVTPEALRRFAQKQRELARNEASTKEILLKDTDTYKKFIKLFGCSFSEIEKEGKAEEVSANLMRDKQRRLDFQKFLVKEHVGSILGRFSNNGFSLMEMFHIRHVQSGSLWNRKGYLESLLKGLLEDTGTQGKIQHKMMQRASSTLIHVIKPSTVEQFNDVNNPSRLKPFLDQLYSSDPESKKIRGLIDVGGFFKNFPGGNEAIAREYFSWIQEAQKKGLADDKIKAVLFYDKEEGGNEYNTLFAYMMDGDKLQKRKLNGTTESDLKDIGLTKEEITVYFDPIHTYGADIPLPEDAKLKLLINASTTLSALNQGYMRGRGALDEQREDFVITEEDEKYFKEMFFGKESLEKKDSLDEENGEKKLGVQHLICACWHAELIKKTREMPRYFDLQINEIFKKSAYESLYKSVRSKKKEALKELYAKVRRDIVTESIYEGYKCYGQIPQKAKCKELLKKRLKNKFVDRGSPENLKTKVEKLLLHIENSTCLPEFWDDTTSDMGVELLIENNTENQTLQEQNTQRETETLLELKQEVIELGKKYVREIRPESQLTKDNFFKLLNAEGEIALDVKGAKDSLGLHHLKNKLAESQEDRDYSKVFSQPIYGTSNCFFFSQKTEIRRRYITDDFSIDDKLFHPSKEFSIFDPRQKSLRQAILRRNKQKNNEKAEYSLIFISENEAKDCFNYLNELYNDPKNQQKEDVWLIGEEGNSLIDHPQAPPVPVNDRNVQKLIWEMNLLLGKASYLDENLNLTKECLSTDLELKERFLLKSVIASTIENGSTVNREWEIAQNMLINLKKKKNDEQKIDSSELEKPEKFKTKNFAKKLLPVQRKKDKKEAQPIKMSTDNLLFQPPKLMTSCEVLPKTVEEKDISIIPFAQKDCLHKEPQTDQIQPQRNTKYVKEQNRIEEELKDKKIEEENKKKPEETNKPKKELKLKKIEKRSGNGEIEKIWKMKKLGLDQKAIQKVGFREIQYLSPDQYYKIAFGWRAVYALGVLTLGLVLSPVALVAQLALLPFRRCCVPKQFLGTVTANPRRLVIYMFTIFGIDCFKKARNRV